MPTRPVPTDPKVRHHRFQRHAAGQSSATHAMRCCWDSLALPVSSGEVRRILTGWIFAEMRSRLGFIARNLTSMPIGADPTLMPVL